ncbi:hypothetical protein [Polaromonas sp. A23]|uniref:hypothetical protein n=1 Tax=Polaromonas sp. A23 TaxID=1944133 RepID=UPI0009853105|nr:hypothetical protein [Polaromonas sp. A23]
MRSLTSQQLETLKEAGASEPKPFHLADLSRPFVYDRAFGVFYCVPGHHRCTMSLLLAYAKGYESGIDAAEDLDLDFPDETADRWLEEVQGTAFRSSVGHRVQVGKRANLTLIEKRWLGEVEYVFD